MIAPSPPVIDSLLLALAHVLAAVGRSPDLGAVLQAALFCPSLYPGASADWTAHCDRCHISVGQLGASGALTWSPTDFYRINPGLLPALLPALERSGALVEAERAVALLPADPPRARLYVSVYCALQAGRRDLARPALAPLTGQELRRLLPNFLHADPDSATLAHAAGVARILAQAFSLSWYRP